MIETSGSPPIRDSLPHKAPATKLRGSLGSRHRHFALPAVGPKLPGQFWGDWPLADFHDQLGRLVERSSDRGKRLGNDDAPSPVLTKVGQQPA